MESISAIRNRKKKPKSFLMKKHVFLSVSLTVRLRILLQVWILFRLQHGFFFYFAVYYSVQKMTKDGLVEENLTDKSSVRVSNRASDVQMGGKQGETV